MSVVGRRRRRRGAPTTRENASSRNGVAAREVVVRRRWVTRTRVYPSPCIFKCASRIDPTCGVEPTDDERIRQRRGSALHAHPSERRYRIESGGSAIVLGVPLGAGTAHVVQLGPVAVEQALGQVPEDVGEVSGQTLGLAAGGQPANCLSHDPSPVGCFLLPLSVRSWSSLSVAAWSARVWERLSDGI